MAASELQEVDTTESISQKLKENEYKFAPYMPKRSPVWDMFRNVLRKQNGKWETIEGFIGCSRCCHVNKYEKVKHNTSNLLFHDCVRNRKQYSVEYEAVVLSSVDDATKKEFSDALTMYAIDNYAHSVAVSGAGFEKLLKLIFQIGRKYGAHIDIDDLLSLALSNWIIYKHFQLDSKTNKIKCLVNGCNKSLSDITLSNMKQHLTTHPSLAAKPTYKNNPDDASPSLLCVNTESVDSDSFSHSKKVQKKSHNLTFDKNLFLKGCIKMVIDNNLSFKSFNSEGFQMVVDPITAALDSTVNTASVLETILEASIAIKAKIRLELQATMFCLIVDAITKNGKSFVTLSAQFLEGVDLIGRTLCFVELAQFQTRDYLKNQIVNFLEKNGIRISQVYSIIVENATSNTNYFNVGKKEDVETDDRIDDNIIDILETYSLNFISPERCVAHNLQLVGSDILKLYESEVKTIRSIVYQINLPKYRHFFVDQPTLQHIQDLESRPMTTYLMIKNIKDNISFYKNLFDNPDAELNVEPNVVEFIDNFAPAFEPLYVAVQKCQEKQMIIGDFLVIWLQCKMDCRKVGAKYVYSKFILETMDLRQSQLFDSDTFQAALYMDPRFNFAGSSLLSPLQKNVAKNFIFKTWTSIKACNHEQASAMEVGPTTNIDTYTSELDAFFEAECGSKNTVSVNDDIDIMQKISNLCNSTKIPLATNVLQLWEWKRYDEPELYKIAQVVLSVSSTQVTVGVSVAYELMTTYLKQKVDMQTIGNIIITKLNSKLLESIEIT